MVYEEQTASLIFALKQEVQLSINREPDRQFSTQNKLYEEKKIWDSLIF
ncbi:hypothetical protein ADIAL_1490 [Alkalibacterium sp. AK22]|nr:hypothetical protein ADIAL_1490 [Alkalibacterium sp. AK22]